MPLKNGSEHYYYRVFSLKTWLCMFLNRNLILKTYNQIKKTNCYSELFRPAFLLDLNSVNFAIFEFDNIRELI